MKTEAKIPPAVRLNFAKDDLIVKEGDYGISVYEIISGKVGVYVDSNGTEIMVAALNPGMIIGEMAFLAGNATPRSATVRALEDCCLEAWHPKLLTNDYKQMPIALRQIVDQSLKRLVRVNKKISGLSIQQRKIEKSQVQDSTDPWASKRSAYRKKVNIGCVYRPINSPKELKLLGRIRDISKGGMQLVIKTSNSLKYSHVPGDEFVISTNLTPGKEVKINAKIANLRKGQTAATTFIGMSFTHMTHEDQKRLGFFLLP
jgi:hypothetical protein